MRRESSEREREEPFWLLQARLQLYSLVEGLSCARLCVELRRKQAQVNANVKFSSSTICLVSQCHILILGNVLNFRKPPFPHL